MAQGDLRRIIEQAKKLLEEDSEWYKSFTESDSSGDLATASGVLARLSITSKWSGTVSKDITIEASGIGPNFSDSAKSAINKAIASINWATQRGSDSPEEAARKALLAAAKKAGAEVAENYRANKSNSSAEVVISGTRRTALRNKLDTSIITLINAKLPEAIRNNMRPGMPLQTRTGRFSESARITGLSRTERDYARLEYTYQRSPYDVFDTALGAPPWNKPGRDPKKIIEKSIRDIAKDLALERFYVRRQTL